jgi:hypothetical protein
MTLLIPSSVLGQARRFMEDAGANGDEGTGMLAGVVEGDDARVTRFIAPDQRTGGVAGGWVEVTQNGKMELALALRAEERYLARIHSHPGAAFHSWTDDRNPGLTAEGSFSLVVPYFGLGLRRGIQACAVYRLRRERWVELSPQELEREVRVIPDA